MYETARAKAQYNMQDAEEDLDEVLDQANQSLRELLHLVSCQGTY